MSVPRRLSPLLLAAALAAPAVAQEPLRVFIRAGEKTHGPGEHDHPRFLAEWSALLAERGCEVAGAESFPTAEQLGAADVLVMYAAEGGSIHDQQRADLEGFLARGGGIVVIHDAVCGDDPRWFKDVVGGAWEHGHSKYHEGEVGLYFDDHQHPITRGVSNFDLEDEIYWDLHLAPEAHVLASSFHTVFDVKPQMWTYEKDGYRAFVSVPGHETATFELAPYRTLLLRGIAWAGKRDADLFVTEEEVAALRYPEGGPRTPEEAAESLVLHPDFELSLVAAEPLIVNPISIDWDAAGRMWVACTPGYPEKQEFSGIPAQDYVAILEDTDGDGRMDAREVFHEGLDLVTSLVFSGSGVIVAQAPELLWLVDTDGDDRCDRVITLFRGFGYSDTHAVISNLRWGLDGWIYGTQGYSGNGSNHVIGADGKDHGKIGNGVFRFLADGSRIEQVASYGSNTWGLDLSWDGELFFTMANGSHLRHLVVPDRVLEAGRYGDARSWVDVTDHSRVFPLTEHERPPYQQIDFVGGFTAASGCLIESGGAWPREFDGNHFVAEPTVNLVHRDLLEPRGATYVASKPREEEFLASTDLWFRPVHLRTGPDGAMYLLDFYNQAAVHNDTRGPDHGPTNAAVRPDRDHLHGRIWRVQHLEARDVRTADLSGGDVVELVEALASPNRWERMTAHRMLLQSQGLTGSLAVALGPRPEQTDAERVHRMWLRLFKRIVTEEELYAGLKSGPAGVRRNAVRVAGIAGFGRSTEMLEQVPSLWLRTGLVDSNPRVRLETLIAYARRAPDAFEVELLVDVWPQLDDDWQRSAFMASTAHDPVAFVHAVTGTSNRIGSKRRRLPEHTTLVADLARRIGREGDPQHVTGLLASLAEEGGAVALAGLRAFSETVDFQKAAPRTVELGNALDALLGSRNPDVVLATIPLAAQWDARGSFRDRVDSLVASLYAQIVDPDTPLERRLESLEILLKSPRYQVRAAQEAALFLDPYFPLDVQTRVVEGVGRVEDPVAAGVLLDAYPTLSSEGRARAFASILERPEWTMLLLDRVEAGELAPTDLGPSRLFRLRHHPDPAVAERASALLDRLHGEREQETAALIEDLLPIVTQPGDVAKGKELFTQNCATCHTFQGEGAEVGPELTGMGLHGPAALLPFVIDPNRAVDDAYVEYVARTLDGKTYGGVLVREGRGTVVLRSADGEVELRRDELEMLQSTGRSPMPTGLEDLGPEALRDIFAYMGAGQAGFRAIDLGGVATASTLTGMYDPREPVTYEFTKRGVVLADGIPFELLDPTRSASGNDVIVLKGGMAQDWACKTRAPQRVEIPVGRSLERVHVLGGVAAWGFPYTRERPDCVRWTWNYEDGETEEVLLTDGVHFADWIRPHDVPGSKRVEGLLKQGTRGQLRRFSVAPSRNEQVRSITLESFDNHTAPTFLSMTAQLEPGAVAEGELWDASRVAVVAPELEVVVTRGERPVRLVGGGTSHDYAAWYRGADARTLGEAGYGPIAYTDEPSLALGGLDGVPLLVLSNNMPLPADARGAVFEHVDDGGGLLLLHAATWYNWADWPEYNRELVCGGSRGHERYQEFEVEVVAPDHPITAGLPATWRVADELYRFERDESGPEPEVLAIGRSLETGEEYPVVWTVPRDGARVACITLGHDGAAHESAEYQRLLSQAARWAAPSE